MANRLQLRHGSTVPTTSNLLSYELGWDETHHILYINNNGTIKKVGGEGSFLPLTGGTLSGNVTISRAAQAEIILNNTNKSHSISLSVNNTTGYGGIYDNTNSKWIVYSQTDGTVILNGNANSATKATQDGNGDTISSTYLKLSGGTMSGNLTITKAGEVNIYANNTTQGHNISLCAGGSGKGGVYDNTNSKWIVYAESGGTVVLNGGANQIITKGTVGTRSVYVTTSASVPSGAVAGDIVLVKV